MRISNFIKSLVKNQQKTPSYLWLNKAKLSRLDHFQSPSSCVWPPGQRVKKPSFLSNLRLLQSAFSCKKKKSNSQLSSVSGPRRCLVSVLQLSSSSSGSQGANRLQRTATSRIRCSPSHSAGQRRSFSPAHHQVLPPWLQPLPLVALSSTLSMVNSIPASSPPFGAFHLFGDTQNKNYNLHPT